MQQQDIKKYSAIVAGFIALYLIFLIALAPADKLISQLQLPKGVSVQGISGSVFSGKAKSVTINQYKIANVNWSMSALSLLAFNPSVAINFGDHLTGLSGSMDASNFRSETLIENASINIDANELVSQLNLPVDVIAGGQIKVDIPSLGLGKPVCSVANGLIQWDKATVNAMAEDVHLGSLKATLACNKGTLEVTVDPNNDLGLDLTAYVMNFERISAKGYLTPGAKFPKGLKPVLGFMGKQDAQGRYTIRF